MMDDLYFDPIYRLVRNPSARAHRELLGWLFERHPEVGGLALYRWVDPTEDRDHWVRTDVSGADLVAKMPSRAPCVLWCDVTNLPSTAQLERMTTVLPAHATGEVLVLSLIDPRWETDTHITTSGVAVRWVAYRDFLTALNGAASTIADSDFERELVERYCATMKQVAAALHEAALFGPQDPIPLEFSAVAYELEYPELKLDRVANRMRMVHARSLIERLSSHAARTTLEVVNLGGKPTLQQTRLLGNGDLLGWRYDGSVWRQYVRTSRHHGSSPQDQTRRLAYAREQYWPWFEVLHSMGSGFGGQSVQGPTVKNRGEVTYSVKVGPLSVEDVVRVVDRIIPMSFQAFGG